MKKTLISTLFSILMLSLVFSGCKKNNIDDNDVVVPEVPASYSFIKVDGKEYVINDFHSQHSSLAGKYKVTRELSSHDDVSFKLVAKNQDGPNLSGMTLVSDTVNVTMTIVVFDEKYTVLPQTELKVDEDTQFLFYAKSTGCAVTEDASKTINYELGYVN